MKCQILLSGKKQGKKKNQIVGDNLHEMSKPVFWEKNKKKINNLSSAELVQSVVMVNWATQNQY